MAEHRHARRGRKVLAGAVAVAVVIGGAVWGVMSARGADDASRYRTAQAELAAVSETLALTGQLSAADSRDATFQTSGTVEEVLVTLGQQVSAGETLATLDPTELEQAVTLAEDALARAQQQLEDNLEAQAEADSDDDDEGTASAGVASSGVASTGVASAGVSSLTVTPALYPSDGTQTTITPASNTDDHEAAVRAAQQALLDAWDVAAAAQQSAEEALLEAAGICAPFSAAELPASDGDDTDLTDAQALLQDCQAALDAASAAQQQTATAQSALNETATALDAAVSALLQAVEDNSSEPQPSEPQPSESPTSEPSESPTAEPSGEPTAGPSGEPTSGPTGEPTSEPKDAPSGQPTTGPGGDTLPTTDPSDQPSSAAPGGALPGGTEQSGQLPDAGTSTAPGGGGAETRTITAERILADRAAVAVAEAELAIAQQELALATLTSPVAGTVVSVGLSAGSSADGSITVQTDGGFVITSTVSLSKLAKLAVGQDVDVTLPALGTTHEATVSTIGIQNVSESSTPAYSVTVALLDADSLRIGATARSTVHLAEAVDVLTVPTSAISGVGADPVVRILVDGQATETPVTIGAIGVERTEIIEGLAEGDVVVLADLEAEIADSTTTGRGGGMSGPTGGFPAGMSDGSGMPPR